jgi:hypothetical protein
MNFLSLSKSPLLLKMPLYTEVPRSFDSLTNPPSVHGLDPGKKEIEAIESLDLGATRARRNPATPMAGSTGKEVGEVCELTKGPFVAGVGVEGNRRRCSAAPSGASCGSGYSGEVEAQLF